MKLTEKLETKDYLSLNAKLAQKKNALRKSLSYKGVLKKEGTNTYDKYKYFSESQYKELFTDLFAQHGLELSFSEQDYTTFVGTEKQSNGRLVKLVFKLTDTETGFWEETEITGEALDKGDKAGYKAYTGALKYYLADTFMVATGDDPEKDSPAETAKPAEKPHKQELINYCNDHGYDVTEIARNYKLGGNVSDQRFEQVLNALKEADNATER